MNDIVAAEVSRLEDALLRMCPFRQWAIFQVTFPDESNLDLDIHHGLTPGGDERVVYTILQASVPTTLWHDRTGDRIPWSTSIVRLRSTTAAASVTLMLGVLASDAIVDPLATPEDDEGNPLQLFPGAVGADGQFTAYLTSDGPSSAFSTNQLGPALELLSPGDAEKDWAIVADTTWGGTDNPRLAFVSKRDGTGAANTNFAMALMSDAADTAGRFYLVPDGSASGQLYIGDDTQIDGTSNYRVTDVNTKDLDVTNGLTERGRTVKSGEWTAVAFSAGNFTGSGAMTWTVASGDQTTYAYTLHGKTMTLAFALYNTTVGGTPDYYLQIAIPGGFTAARTMGGLFDSLDNSVPRLASWLVQTSGTVVLLSRADITVWTAATDTTNTVGTISFEIA